MTTDSRARRCAIYTRKSTEHGLELEFNSLDAQREACEAYVQSQASQGWKILPQHYDDPAFSGGNLDRPALKLLLADIKAGKIDVVVVYKIDRLTRSLADFAKLVEAFDARLVSFVAVTQQFNTTSSMGRLTLNVLLSFAQFERELSSERVRDKIAASRRKGKWTGGTVPLGYESKDKKLIINTIEAETVRTIFRLYLELKSFSKLVAELNQRSIVTKKRDTKVAKYNGAIPFTYGPLAYLLKNRIYIGEVHHGGKWYVGEQAPILDKHTFDRVQAQLATNANGSRVKHFDSGALLQGKLRDDNGNLMKSHFATKNGVRYRFYVSSALLRGRRANVGSVGRVSATHVETAVRSALASHPIATGSASTVGLEMVHSVTIGQDCLTITFLESVGGTPITILWSPKTSGTPKVTEGGVPNHERNEPLTRAIVRAHAWLQQLSDGSYDSVEGLAEFHNIHPKVLRQALRLAYLSPAIIGQILNGNQPSALVLARIPNLLPLPWAEQQRLVCL